MRGPRGRGIGEDGCDGWEGSLTCSMSIAQTGMSAEKGQEAFLAGFQDI